MKEYSNIIETLVSIFTIQNGVAKVLLIRKRNDPYRGYWVMPGDFLDIYTTIEQNISRLLLDLIGLDNIYLEQNKLYSKINRDQDHRVIAASFIGIVDSTTVELKMKKNKEIEMKWFPIDEIPKLGYDHSLIVEDCISALKTKIRSFKMMRQFFPSDFTMPELQRAYEQILHITFDRRNFQKKMKNLQILEDTGEKNDKTNGRPAHLYQFKEEKLEEVIF